MTSGPPSSAPRHAANGGRGLWLAGALVALVFLIYYPALHGGFVWDDDAHVTAPALRSWDGLVRIWSEPGATQQYYPVLHTAFWVENRAWGTAAAGYHAANFLLHASAALLFLAILRQLAVPGAWFAAFLFALHPVHVESVAWVSEQKNTLSAVFYLGAAWLYLRFDQRRSRRAYVAASLLFGSALLTKSVTATLPAALIVLAWWRRGSLSWRRDVAPLVPWCVVGLAAGLFTAWVERHLIGAQGPAFALSPGERLQLCGRALWFYAGKLFWPADLSFVYPRWNLESVSGWHWLPLAVAAAVAAGCCALRRQTRAPLTVLLLFVGTLFPVLGFLNVYPFIYSFVADHFQYLASLPVLAAAAAGLTRATRSAPRLAAGAIAGILLAFGSLTVAQSRTYRSYETLLRSTIARNPACWMAFNNLGKELMGVPARRPEAIECFERALALRPDYPEAENNLGLTLTQTGRASDGVPHLQRARRLDPRSYQAANNLGIALASSGRAEEALAVFAQAARLGPEIPNIQDNWGKALLLLGRRGEANEHFARAAELRARALRNR